MREGNRAKLTKIRIYIESLLKCDLNSYFRIHRRSERAEHRCITLLLPANQHWFAGNTRALRHIRCHLL